MVAAPSVPPTSVPLSSAPGIPLPTAPPAPAPPGLALPLVAPPPVSPSVPVPPDLPLPLAAPPAPSAPVAAAAVVDAAVLSLLSQLAEQCKVQGALLADMATRDREHRAPPPPATTAAAATPAPPTTAPSAAPSVKVFSTQTVTSVNSSTYKSLATDLSPESLKLFLQRFTERLKLAHPAVSVVLNTPAGDWEALIAARPDLADADA